MKTDELLLQVGQMSLKILTSLSNSPTQLRREMGHDTRLVVGFHTGMEGSHTTGFFFIPWEP